MPTEQQLISAYNTTRASKFVRDIEGLGQAIPRLDVVTSNANSLRLNDMSLLRGKPAFHIGALNAGKARNTLLPPSYVQSDHAADIFTKFESLCFRSRTYRDIKQNQKWIKMYGADRQSLLFWLPPNKVPRNVQTQQTGNGNVACHLPQADCMPCHYCGIVLPIELIQVDHRQPKSHSLGAAIAKCLNALSRAPYRFTQALSINVGSRARQFEKLTQQRGQPDHQIVRGKSFNHQWREKNLTNNNSLAKRNRYTLTDQGRTLLTLGTLFYGSRGFPDMCVNSFFNLVPACARCNGSAGKGDMLFAR